MKIYYTLLSLSIAAALTLSGCGGSGDSSTPTTNTSTPAAQGALSINIIGLPENDNIKAIITGPNGYSQNLTTSTNLTGLAAGNYKISTNTVNLDRRSYDVLPATYNVEVAANQTETLGLIYQTQIASVGAISNFGSVFVNGIRFDSDDSDIEIDDIKNAESALKIGMKVNVEGRVTADGSIATASRIAYDADIKGPIESISLTGNFLFVLGQKVFIGTLTEFDDVQFNDLLVGDVIELSILQQSDSSFLATRLELQSNDNASFEISGRVSNLDQVNNTFLLNQITIEYSQANLQVNLQNGSLVEVKFYQRSPSGAILAVDIESDGDDYANGYFSTEGIIAEVNPQQIKLASGEVIIINQDTDVENGQVSELVEGLRVAVDIERENGQSIADDIWIIDKNEVQIRSVITDLADDNSSIKLLGQDFVISNFTVFVDKSSLAVRTMRIENLAIGDEVEVVGGLLAQDEDDDQHFLATRVTRFAVGVDAQNQREVELEGHLQAVTASSVSVRGVQVDYNAATQFYNDKQQQFVTAEVFFETATVGNEVEVDALILDDGSVLAYSVEFDGQDDDGDMDNAQSSVKIEGRATAGLFDNAFFLNNREILINGNTQFDNGDLSQLIEGASMEVRVKETEQGYLALHIEFEDDDGEKDIELTGTISGVNNNNEFVLDGITVIITPQTSFDDATPTALQVGMLIEVEGFFDYQGRLIAQEIDIEGVDDSETKISGPISQLTESQFVIGDITISIASDLTIEDGNRLKLADDVYVDVAGKFDAENIFVARKLKFEDDNSGYEIEGIISEVSGDTIKLAEVFIKFDSAVTFEDGSLSRLVAGTYVQIDAAFIPQEGFVATKIVFKSDED